MIQYIRNIEEFLQAAERCDTMVVAEHIEMTGEFTVNELVLVEAIEE